MAKKAKPWLKFYRPDLSPSLTYPEVPLYELLYQTARKYPNHIAVSYEGAKITYARLRDYVDRCATALSRLGVAKGGRVALFMPNIPQFIIAFYGVLRLGAVAVPCNPLYKERELEFQLNDSGSEVLVAACDVVKGHELYESVRKCRARTGLKHVLTTSVTDTLSPVKRFLAPLAKVRKTKYPDTADFMALLRAHPPNPPQVEIRPVEDLAVLQYTGGTTGVSKGAMLTHYNLVANAVVVASWLPIAEGKEIGLAVLPFFHIYGLTVAMNATIYGAGTIVPVAARFEAKAVLEKIQKERVTLFPGVPTMYVALVNHPEVGKYDLKTVRGCFSGAAALPVAVMKRFNELTGANLAEGFGLTEASPVTHVNPLDSREKVKAGSIGIPLPDTDSRIVDLAEPSKELPVGEVGELAVKGPQVMKGYWNRPEETANVLKNGWLLTGDIAKMDGDGYFYIVDRKKDMIDVSGFKVWPRDVEEVLFEHEAVKEAAVIGVPDPYRGENVKAFVVLKEGYAGKVTAEDLMAFCKERVAAYKVPKMVEFRSELPKTLIGKVLRRALREEELKKPA